MNKSARSAVRGKKMAQTENSKISTRSSGSNKPPEPGFQRAGKHLHQARRRSFVRKMVLTAFLALGLFLLLFIGREWQHRNVYKDTMQQLARHVDDFKKSHKLLPTREQMLKFQLHTRINTENINYEPSRIIDSSPSDTLLAYSPPLELKFLPGGYAVLDIGGRVQWLTHQQLAEKIQSRDQFYNAAILKEKTSQGFTPGRE
jgi:hypothetical protein